MASGAGVDFDLKEWRALTRNLKNSAPSAYSALRKAMGPAMKPVAEEARKLAGFSDKIPQSIVSGSRGAVGFVQAGGSAAPDAAPLEHRGRPGVFRHPLWGSWGKAPFKNHGKQWVNGDPRNQRAHPFLNPAADQQATTVADMLTKAVTDAIANELSE